MSSSLICYLRTHLFCYNSRWYPPQPSVETIVNSIKSQFTEPWPTWMSMPKQTRDVWWNEFKVLLVNLITLCVRVFKLKSLGVVKNNYFINM
jgi:hypothetical protein